MIAPGRDVERIEREDQQAVRGVPGWLIVAAILAVILVGLIIAGLQ